ncbi:ABC transporter permease subunit/CPBP intramembrane protease [Thalassoroseus pseudoceratinae]|uniref:ABC transporter permease subunit/CPBP intramembrane protease n=1 Tax=Thalassoroseus pseudoceratinae TaxID=2713176 RepID=UPI00197D1410|nr:ABC transporter permease subunit/CPBP intramembrane protease [Thalassoroseus pseudoceratinae]
MRWKNIRLIFTREVRDQLRDRRTLFMVAVLPILLYPALGLGMVQMMLLFNVQARTVVVLGADDLPTTPSLRLIQKGNFNARYFDSPGEVETLRVIADPDDTESLKHKDRLDGILASESKIRKLVNQIWQLDEEKIAWIKERHPAGDVFPKQKEMQQLKDELAETTAGADVVLLVPKDFAEHIHDLNRKIAARETIDLDSSERPYVIKNSADEKSMVAARRVQGILDRWEDAVLQHRLQEASLPQSLPQPVNPIQVDLAEDKQRSAFVWSQFFPAILVIMAVTGAFYPSVDLAAGEKERGTMETLLISPAARSEIVIGKFLTVLLFSMATALLNLASMGFTSRYMASVAQDGMMEKLGNLAPPSAAAIIWMIVLLIPLASLFSALCLALATFARSTKEGQYYLTPLLLVTMGLTVFCLSPGVEISPLHVFLPIVGVALLLKEVLADPTSTLALTYALPVLMGSIGYSLLALWWAIEQFSKENVLFREAERFDLRLWVQHLFRDKEATPSFVEAFCCFGLIMMLQFFSMQYMQQAAVASAQDPTGVKGLQQLLVQQIALIATPALLMGVLFTTDFRRTFRLRMPSWSVLGVAAILPFFLHPLVKEMMTLLEPFFPPLPPGVVRVMKTMSSDQQPLWLLLLAFAATPAICEEIAFRGFILSGLSRTRRIGLATALSAIAFGMIHMIPQQVFYTSLMGLVLGLIAFRGGSLLPPIAFHFIFNALNVVLNRYAAQENVIATLEGPVLNWFFACEDGGVTYRWPLLTVAAIGASLGIYWLISKRSDPRALPVINDPFAADPSQKPMERSAVGVS